MPASLSWIHGNALTMESPIYFRPDGEPGGRLILTPMGWGAQVVTEGHAVVSWMHIPIPSVRRDGPLTRFNLRRVFLLGECADAEVSEVHVYDGRQKLEEFSRTLTGDFLTKDFNNTFVMASPRTINTGVGVSFLFKGQVSPAARPRLSVAAAGAEFDEASLLLTTVGEIFRRVRP